MERVMQEEGAKKSMTGSGAKEHKGQLESLQQKDPDFYEFLKEHDQELLEFSDDDIDEDLDADMEDGDLHADEEATEHEVQEKDKKSSKKVITTAMVDLWCKSIKENGSLNAVRSLMKAFRTARALEYLHEVFPPSAVAVYWAFGDMLLNHSNAFAPKAVKENRTQQHTLLYSSAQNSRILYQDSSPERGNYLRPYRS